MTPEEIEQKFLASPHLAVSDAEAEVLLAASERSLIMEKLLAIWATRKGDFKTAISHARQIFAQEKSSENAKSLALMMRRLGRPQEAIDFTHEHKDLFDPVVWNDTLCMMHGALRDWEAAKRHGNESLKLKEGQGSPAPTLAPVLHAFNPETSGRNIIAFSLWGNDRRYIEGAQHNAIVARYLYPGWTARFYVDASVAEPVRKALSYQGAQVVEAPSDWPAEKYGLFWRFLVEDDPAVDIYVVRDADSVLNIKERAAVEDWLASGKAFHVMRDLPTHAELILAGMWGAHRGNIGGMRARVEAHLDSPVKRLNDAITDQVFLRREIWPIARQSALVHDDHFDFADPTRFRKELRLPRAMHVGQNDWALRSLKR
jgi:hypothetical protein